MVYKSSLLGTKGNEHLISLVLTEFWDVNEFLFVVFLPRCVGGMST